MLLGRLYGPSDLYFASEPWKSIPTASSVGALKNPILSDLAFANLPWRAAVRESLANGRLPLWNRFVLAGSPLLATAQAGVLHPSTWLGVWLPVPLSWTFSCTFTLFLGLLAGFLFFRDFGLGARAALVGAVGWGFSTYMVFWNGWSVGPSTATFPLLLLGLRRLSRAPNRGAMGLTVAALWLSFCGGHPETFFHSVAAGGVYFLWELAGAARSQRPRAVGMALAAGGLALLLCGPQLFPLLEAIPHSAEYRARREALASATAGQSVSLGAAAARLLPDVLPFAHGIYGKSPVDAERNDGSGMPIGYAGAMLFPLACLAFAARPAARGRGMFLALLLAGLAYGASFPGLMDLTARLPGFALALNYRLVFLAGLGIAGLAAFGAQHLESRADTLGLVRAGSACVAVLFAVFMIARPFLTPRGLSPSFLWRQLAFEIGPVLALGVVWHAVKPTGARLVTAALVLLVGQRFLEMRGTYPTLPASTLVPPLPTLATLPIGGAPARIVAGGDVFRPNAAAFYGIEDARGYESLVLDRFADTYPLWSRAQASSFNRVDDLAAARPFLSLLNVSYAIGGPADPVPEGWREQARGPELAIFENPGALPRAFVPRALRRVSDPAERLAAMAALSDFAATALLAGKGPAEQSNGEAALAVRESGPDLVVEASVSSRVFVATSLSDWPGWIAEADGRALRLETVNHAFVGFWLEPGRHGVRLTYRPASWTLGLAAFAAGCLIWLALAVVAPRRRPA
jgi:Bacterial membrane protein YfhO